MANHRERARPPLDPGERADFSHLRENGAGPIGGRARCQFGEFLDDFAIPYYLVPGNHDSPANREALGLFANVTVVDGEVVDLAGVRVLGVAHPSFTADNRVSEEEVERDLIAQGAGTTELVGRLRPDVLALHDGRAARASFGHVPLVLAGHVHRSSWKTIQDTLVITVGTTGATGLGASPSTPSWTTKQPCCTSMVLISLPWTTWRFAGPTATSASTGVQ